MSHFRAMAPTDATVIAQTEPTNAGGNAGSCYRRLGCVNEDPESSWVPLVKVEPRISAI